MKAWIVNDFLTTIPGTRTLWHMLSDWFAAPFIGGDFSHLADIVETTYAASPDKPDVIIRNGSYFRSLRLPVKTVALFQDIFDPTTRSQQAEVAATSHLVVYNSEYTRANTPNAHRSATIPLPVDFGLWTTAEWPVEYDVVWVGAQSSVKGYDVLLEVVHALPETRFALVFKDAAPEYLMPNCRAFVRLPHSELARLYARCRVGLCTSRSETQHLAGIEMGAAGLPLVATNVGIYYNRRAGVWGVRSALAADEIAAALKAVLRRKDNRGAVRDYWLGQGLTEEDVKRQWLDAVAGIADGK